MEWCISHTFMGHGQLCGGPCKREEVCTHDRHACGGAVPSDLIRFNQVTMLLVVIGKHLAP